MKISARRDSGGRFTVAFDDLRITLDDAEVRLLLAKLKEVAGSIPPAESHRRLVAQIKAANDPGIQALLRTAAEDDLLVLLKLGERDIGLRAKLYGNMSPRARAMFQEDLAFKFKDGVPKGQLALSLARLHRTLAALGRDGVFTVAHSTTVATDDHA